MVKFLILLLALSSGCGPLSPNVSVHMDGKVDTSGAISVSPVDLNVYFTSLCQSQFTASADVNTCAAQYVTSFTNFMRSK